MSARTFRNTDVSARTWTALTDPATGRTLHLPAGGETELDLPGEFTDPFLVPRPARPGKRTTSPEAPAPDAPETEE